MPAEMTMLADHPARQLLDFNQKLDINLLDSVVNSMYHDIGNQVRVIFFCQRCLCVGGITRFLCRLEQYIFFTEFDVVIKQPELITAFPI